jgi:hypothetical protein
MGVVRRHERATIHVVPVGNRRRGDIITVPDGVAKGLCHRRRRGLHHRRRRGLHHRRRRRGMTLKELFSLPTGIV